MGLEIYSKKWQKVLNQFTKKLYFRTQKYFLQLAFTKSELFSLIGSKLLIFNNCRVLYENFECVIVSSHMSRFKLVLHIRPGVRNENETTRVRCALKFKRLQLMRTLQKIKIVLSLTLNSHQRKILRKRLVKIAKKGRHYVHGNCLKYCVHFPETQAQ